MASTNTALSNLQSTVNTFTSNMNAELKKVDNAVVQIDNEVVIIHNKVLNLRELMTKNEEKQLAHESVIRLEQELNEKLKSYKDVRRVMLGVIKDFDINLVRNKTINELSEELWMGASRYWLSYALITVSAWIMDNKQLADNALMMGMRHDPVKTALFFCLFNIRFMRSNAAKQWLTVYFENIDPTNASEETAILLQAYLSGAFGHDKTMEYIVGERIRQWERDLSDDNNASEDLYKGFYNYVANKAGNGKFESDVMEECCVNIEDVKRSYAEISKFADIQKIFEQYKDVKPITESEEFKDLIDSILWQLVEQPDASERQLLNDKKYYEMVMAAEGNVAAAEAEFKEYLQVSETENNIGKTMLKWLLYSNEEEAPKQIKKFSLKWTKSWFRKGSADCKNDIVTKRPSSFGLRIMWWQGTTDGKDRDGTEASLVEAINSKKLQQAIFSKFNIIFVIAALIIAVIAIPVVTANVIAGVVLFVAAFVILAVVGVLIFLNIKHFDNQVNKAKAMLEQCFNEIDRYFKEYDEYIEKEIEFETFLNNFE